MNRIVALCVAVLLAGAGGCWRRAAADPPPCTGDPALEVIARAASSQVAKPAAKEPEKCWIDNVDVDKIASNPWVIAGIFLLVQWFEIWYFNRTGHKSTTIDAAEAAMAPKLGIVQRILYRLWRWIYFWKHKDQKDPDKDKEDK